MEMAARRIRAQHVAKKGDDGMARTRTPVICPGRGFSFAGPAHLQDMGMHTQVNNMPGGAGT